MVEDVDSEQLTNYTYNYLKENDFLGDELPSRDEFPPLTNRVETDSVIDGEAGWIIFSHQLRTVRSLDKTQCQEREITIK